MAVTSKKVNRPALTADYDREGDVLYIAVGDPRPSEGEDLERGIVARYPFDDPANAWGITIIGFNANGWDNKIDELTLKIGNLLAVSRSDVGAIIRRTIGHK